MQQVLKQSAAATTIIGPVLDAAGAIYTGLVISELNIAKNGTTAAMAAGTLTHDHNGHYILAFISGHTDTLGRLDVTCNKSGYAMPPKVFEVLPATTFDAIVTNDAGTAGGLPYNGNNTGTVIPTVTAVTNRVTANVDELNGTSIAGTGTRVADAFVVMFNVAGPVLTTASVNQTGDSFSRIGATGSGLTSLAPASTALSTVQWTNGRAANLDNLDAAVSTRSTVTTAQVNAEVVDALATDTYVEPSSAPGATVTLAAKLGYLYSALRNKITVTSGSKAFYTDAGASLYSKALSDDGTTYTEAEAA